MKNGIKTFFKVWLIYICSTWIFYGASRNAIGMVGMKEPDQEQEFEWAWITSFRNFKTAWKEFKRRYF